MIILIIAPLPDYWDYLPAMNDEDKQMFFDANAKFLSDCSIFLRSVIGATKKFRNPLAPEWNHGLPVFLCGGGSGINLYKKMIQHAEERLKAAGFAGFDLKVLPKPNNLEGDDIPPREYHRVAVSYGLSHSEIDLGQIIPQREIVDFEYRPDIANVDKWYVDKDMV